MGNRTQETVVSQSYEIKRQQQKEYDELSRLLRTIGADGQVTEFGYDRNGNVTRITDALQHTTHKAYDGLNRLVSSIDALGAETRTVYNEQGAVAEVTDARGVVTRYEYNGFGEVVSLISQDTGTTHYQYDEAGNLIEKVDANQMITQYRYDVLNRVTEVIYPQAPEENIRYRYDVGSVNAIGRVAQIQDQTGRTQRSYNAWGNVEVETQHIQDQQYNLAYEYDAAGNLTGMVYPNGVHIRYHRDALGRVESITRQTPWGESEIASSIEYLPFGPLANLRYGNGLLEQKFYDQDYRLQEHRIANLYHKEYQYDAVGNIRAILDGNSAANDKHYLYDAVNRLTEVENGFKQQESFKYDAVGNRTEYLQREHGQMVEQATYHYAHHSNRLLSVESVNGPRSLLYDQAGNTIHDQRNGAHRVLEYGANNRLKLVSKDGVLAAQYQHNAQGQRVIRVVEGKTTHYIYDVNDRLVAEANGDGQVQRQYVYLGRTLIAMEDAANQDWFYVHNDHLGTPKQVTDTAAQLVWQSEASAFGETDEQGEIAFAFRFPGQMEDGVTGYFYNYFRDYDASLGRYIQSDPIGLMGGVNTFVYVNSSPPSGSDYYGLVGPIPVIVALVATKGTDITVTGVAEFTNSQVRGYDMTTTMSRTLTASTIAGILPPGNSLAKVPVSIALTGLT